MQLTTESGVRFAATQTSPDLMFCDAASAASGEIIAALEARGYRVRTLALNADAETNLRRDRPDLLITASVPPDEVSPASEGLKATALQLGVPIVEILDRMPEASSAQELSDLEDWVFRSQAAVELPFRVARLLSRRDRTKNGRRKVDFSADTRLLPLIVHDMRTPLNVISLSLRMVEQAVPKGNPELDEDLRFVEENFDQIERMLALLSDYCRLYEVEGPGSAVEFSPRQLLAELVEEHSVKASSRSGAVRLELGDSCPPEAVLDPHRVRQALRYALDNAAAACSNGAAVSVTLNGGPRRWVTRIAVDQPPPPFVKSVELRSHAFERLCGTAAERRGMDLAIVARISEMFGGSARLEVVEGQRSTLVLDWPIQLGSAG